ncbi:MAG TPA: type II toxin-antitoxin system prevent-host-death family antitoxin [Streptomyces sp.]|nr:type II toxin-antitoxin system prevent-host-death family antitoxin [Streptomyces sp.]
MSITASEARKNLFPLIEKVNDDRSPIHITSRNGNAVLLSEEEFSSWQETIYLLRSPANARRLAESVAEAEKGKTEPRELIEVDDSE